MKKLILVGLMGVLASTVWACSDDSDDSKDGSGGATNTGGGSNVGGGSNEGGSGGSNVGGGSNEGGSGGSNVGGSSNEGGSGGSNVGGGSNEGGSGGASTDDCESCQMAECASEVNACLASQQCQDFVKCNSACTDNDCRNACLNEYPDGAELWVNGVQCTLDKCKEPCGFSS
ncbi:MAG TPA: hypothetical protein PLN90_19085 [Polyangiaceae bacterium]|nr:hypothetical protein [Polyangiaceae bacterium]HOR37080.1 hypothetical protein [Polyangiaceae bacterium]HPY19018.1 hypothetical protein [Polyangiaceae bacterium]HQB44235.1 hypothetical protein [Polyangiaceae bacterium]HQF23515.1 hypothetical protein [Polyangiaceae bacterium]